MLTKRALPVFVFAGLHAALSLLLMLCFIGGAKVDPPPFEPVLERITQTLMYPLWPLISLAIWHHAPIWVLPCMLLNSFIWALVCIYTIRWGMHFARRYSGHEAHSKNA